MDVRQIQESDAAALLELCTGLDHETLFMMLEPGERTATVAETVARIRGVLASDNSTILVAEENGRLAGYVEATGGEFSRNRHSAYLVMGVLHAFAGRGAGRALLTDLERWACDRGLLRLELTVMTHNTAAIALYTRMGFVIEGARRCSVRVDGRCVDEYAMARTRNEG